MLLEDLINSFNERGFFFLNQVGNKDYTTGSTRWISGKNTNLDTQHISTWNQCIHSLNNSLAWLSDQEDQLIWSFNLAGKYSPKLGYLVQLQDSHVDPPPWWEKSI
jgi:hypothetical protein